MNKARDGVILKDPNGRSDRRTSERGQALYLIVSFIVVLMAFASIGVDIAMLWGVQLRMQNAADAAALAGTDSLFGGGSGNITAARRAGSAQNGFTNALGTTGNANLVTVTMNNPPKTGSYAANSQAVEAIVQQTQPTLFMRVAGFSSFPISGRAVSLTSSATDYMYTMNSSASGAFLVNSGGKITSTCGPMVESNSSGAITVNSGATLAASAVGVVGGTQGSGTISPAPVTGITPFGDPLSALQPPTVGTCVTPPNWGSASLSPGYYCGLNVDNDESGKLSPGNYSLNGAVTVKSGGTLSGTGVNLYFKSGALTINSSANANLSAPTSGTNEGILIFSGSVRAIRY